MRRASADLTQLTLTPQPAHHPSPHRPGLHRPPHRRNRTVEQALRSIPACAGEPAIFLLPMIATGVYPRVCGGTPCSPACTSSAPGLSPRVRGNRRHLRAFHRRLRSIPACAGEPHVARRVHHRHLVYPRVCGGTMRMRRRPRPLQGLSPRVRGNRRRRRNGLRCMGSIPACAGEPEFIRQGVRAIGVYPRVCGGTRISPSVFRPPIGLSPRVRGNRIGQPVRLGVNWSIPACAGEPTESSFRSGISPVYPRVCGGTTCVSRALSASLGLSPRVRGNRPRRLAAAARGGSIPACAGEPPLSDRHPRRPEVYPRVCGGTDHAPSPTARLLGLSPRVRGNPSMPQSKMAPPRSIPACAGEPVPMPFRRIGCEVYPRVCGGTSLCPG